MRVGIDGKPLLGRGAGVARYLAGLLAGCTSFAHPDVVLDVVAPPSPRRTLPWVLWDLQRATARGFAAFHFPFYYPPVAPRCPVTVAIHDVLVLEHPEWFPRAAVNPLRLLLARGARRAAAVVTGSRSVAEAIVERCRVPRERLRLIGYGVDRRAFAPPASDRVLELTRRLGLHRPYLLQVGALEPRRGVDLAVAATAALRARHPDLELVLAGERRARVAELLDPPDWVRVLGWAAETDLPALYAGAAAVVAPSRGEGFDLPVLEALACGAAVVASDIAVHREHFETAVRLFASGDADALTEAAEAVLEDAALGAALRAAGPPLAARHDWTDVARRHVDLWREVGRG